MLKIIAIVVAVLVAGLLVLAALKPDTFRVERKAVVKASPDQVRAQIADFRQWPAWSPWEKMDPGMKRTLGGAASGKGATYAWEGNSQVGKGRMEILEDTPSKVQIQLDFLAPFEAHNMAEFTLAPVGADSTEVTWAMYGPSPFMTKVMQVFCSMDKMVGKDFEAGLANLKAVAEK